MNCQEARQLIDQRVHALLSHEPQVDVPEQGVELDGHLESCSKCMGDFLGLLRTRERVACLAADAPTQKEVGTMWNAIEAGLSGGSTSQVVGATMVTKSRSRSPLPAWVKPFAAAGAAVAATLFLAFQIGGDKYGDHVFTMVDTSLPAASANKAFWDAIKDGGVNVQQFISPSSSRESPGVDTKGDGEIASAEAFDAADDLFKVSNVTAADIEDLVDADDDGSSHRRNAGVITGLAATNGSLSSTLRFLARDLETKTEEPNRTAHKTSAKIIKTGQLSVEVETYTDAASRVEALCQQFDAQIADSGTTEQTGGALAGRYVIRVAPERFEALFAELKKIGRVESDNIEAADVTEQYVDITARIQNLRITEARLQELVTQKSIIDKVSALLEVERELSRVRSETEKLQGRMRVMTDRISLSTITMTLHEPARTVPNAVIAIVVPALVSAEQALMDVLVPSGARLISGNTSKRSDGGLNGAYQIEVTLSSFSKLIATIESLGLVTTRQVQDQQFGDANAPWADKVRCRLRLSIQERSRQLPGGRIRMEVDKLSAAIATLEDALAQRGGGIVSNQTSRQNDGSTAAELTVRVPASRFADLVEAIAPLGRTMFKRLTGETGDITGGAADLPRDLMLMLSERQHQVPTGRLSVEVEDFDLARAALTSLIAKHNLQVAGSTSTQRTDGTWSGGFSINVPARVMEDVVTQLESLGRIVSRETKGLGLGELTKVAEDAMGHLSLTLAEKVAFTPGPDQTANTIRNRIRDGLAGFYGSVGIILYGLAVMAPWLLLIVGVAWIVARSYRRRARIAQSAKS